MKKHIVSIFLVAVLVCCFSVATASVGLFSFTTKPQTVLPNALSKEITVQSQNAAAVSESTTETFDLSFTSSSPTGIFLSATGKPVTKTMSKGTANRTFYYKDSSVGDFALTVIATGRDSKKSFTATQNITIGEAKIEPPRVTVPVSKPVSPPVSKPVVQKPIATTPILASTTEELASPVATVETVVFEAQKHESLISKIFNFIKHFFVEE